MHKWNWLSFNSVANASPILLNCSDFDAILAQMLNTSQNKCLYIKTLNEKSIWNATLHLSYVKIQTNKKSDQNGFESRNVVIFPMCVFLLPLFCFQQKEKMFGENETFAEFILFTDED